jgi:hypothetical protein
VQLTRAVLLVEGEHDRTVINHLYGDQLRRHRIRIQPIRGIKNTRAIVEAETLATLGIPLFVLFDSVRAAAITGAAPPPSSDEEGMILSLNRLWEEHHPSGRLEILPFPLPDIFAALPDEAVNQMLAAYGRSLPPGGQHALVELHRSQGAPPNFKRWWLTTLQLPEDADRILGETVGYCLAEPLPNSPLSRAIDGMLAKAARAPGA